MPNKKAFSLIEVIIATGIITISIFGIYKLIGENNKLVNYSNNKLLQNSLITVVKNCIENNTINSNKYLSLGEELSSCNFSDNKKNTNIDNIDYEIFIENGVNNYNITIFSEINGNLNFKIKK